MASAEKQPRGRPSVLTDSAKKRNRKNVLTRLDKSRINIGKEHERWMESGMILDFFKRVPQRTNWEILYESQHSPCKQSRENVDEAVHHGPVQFTSTPGPSKFPFQCSPGVSGISSSDQEYKNIEQEMSCIEDIEMKDKSKSFVNPFELSITFTENEFEDETNEHSSDSDYEPTYNITLCDNNALNAEDRFYQEDILEDDDSDQPPIDFGPGIIRVKCLENVDTLLQDNPFLVYSNQLVALAKIHVTNCTIEGCKSEVTIKKETVASAVYLKWVCSNQHIVHVWCSQPVLNRRLHAGDLLFAASLLMSGSNYQKVKMMCNFLKLPVLSKCTYFRIQRTYLIPSIDDFWLEHQNRIIDSFQGQNLIVMGDGRMDSPGHCSQYCSYTFMEYSTKQILCVITMDKRVTDKKSTNLEKACFIKGLKFLLDKGLNIVEVVTDAHVQVAAYMRKECANIKHSYDVWHGTKNLGKKIIKAGTDKNNKQLMEWTKDVVNHYWQFMGIWIGILHHVTNTHEWILPHGYSNACSHGPLNEEREKGWLKKGSSAHIALRGIVLDKDKRLINNIPYYINCRSTAELENFQNLILMYASKRNSYKPPAYRARNKLAALDHNSHIDRPVLTNKDGSIRYQRMFQKKSSRWSAFPVKTEKLYFYIPDLLKRIVRRRIQDNVGMNQPFVLEVDDPRRLSAHLAPVPPPPTQQIVAEQISRFCNASSNRSVDPDQTIDYVWQES